MAMEVRQGLALWASVLIHNINTVVLSRVGHCWVKECPKSQSPPQLAGIPESQLPSQQGRKWIWCFNRVTFSPNDKFCQVQLSQTIYNCLPSGIFQTSSTEARGKNIIVCWHKAKHEDTSKSLWEDGINKRCVFCVTQYILRKYLEKWIDASRY